MMEKYAIRVIFHARMLLVWDLKIQIARVAIINYIEKNTKENVFVKIPIMRIFRSRNVLIVIIVVKTVNIKLFVLIVISICIGF